MKHYFILSYFYNSYNVLISWSRSNELCCVIFMSCHCKQFRTSLFFSIYESVLSQRKLQIICACVCACAWNRFFPSFYCLPVISNFISFCFCFSFILRQIMSLQLAFHLEECKISTRWICFFFSFLFGFYFRFDIGH